MKKSIVISLLTVTTLFCTAICSLASTGKVTTDTLRVRKEASTDSETVALLSIGDEIEILEDANGWYKIKSGENVGYVAAQYINVLTNTNENIEQVNGDSQNGEETKENTNNEEQNNQNENTENNEENKEPKETVSVLSSGENIYITPLISSLVLNKLEEEKQIEIVSEINGWSYIKTGDISGWVRTESIKSKEVEKKAEEPEKKEEENKDNNSSQKTGYISTNSVNFRKEANTSAEVITKLSRNAKVTVISEEGDWAKVTYNGDTGYVSKDYVSDKEIEVTSRGGTRNSKETAKKETTKTSEVNTSSTPVSTNGKVSGSDVVAYAKQYLGSRYVSGGASPKGFDCSGFTTYVYKHFGISLSRTSSGQASNGRAVSRSELQPGDIICFSNSSSSKRIGHVGIYVGGGQFIHAANSRKGVIISNVSGAGFYFVCARRVV